MIRIRQIKIDVKNDEIEEINGEITAIIGYAHTKGYKSFSGKEWSVVVKEVF